MDAGDAMNIPSDDQFLYQVSRDISQCEDADQILECVLTHVRARFQSEAASLIWVEPDGTQVFRAVQGPEAEKIWGLRLPKGEGVSGWVIDHHEIVWVPDVTEDARFFMGVDGSTGFETNAILAVPLQSHGSVLAVLEIVNPLLHLVINEVRDTLAALAALAVEALEKCTLLDDMRRYQAVFSQQAQPAVLFSPEGYMLEANTAAQVVFALAACDEEAASFDDLHIHKDGFANVVKQQQRAVGETRQSMCWNFTLHQDRLRTYYATLAPVKVRDSTLYQLTLTDITDVIGDGDARLQLFNMLVHDLRVPLGSLHHSIELIMAAWQDSDLSIPVDQVLEIAERSEKRMERLINDILDTTLLDAQTKKLAVTMIDINALVQEGLVVVSTAAERRNQTLVANNEASTETLLGDVDLLQRVLINILSNAVKYTPDGGEIALSVYDDADIVYFSVTDTGPGISPVDEPHIFDLFYRGTSARVKGAGIGLAFSKLAVEAHGGSIWVDQSVKTGARFIFSIPKAWPGNVLMAKESEV